MAKKKTATKKAVAKKAAEKKAAPEPAPTAVRYERELPMMEIRMSPHNPRSDFPAEYIEELAESLAREGLLQPIAVRLVDPDESGRKYEIIMGECRFRAAQTCGWMFIEAKIYEGVSDALHIRMALLENLKRRQLNPIEEAEGFYALLKTGMTQQQVADEVGRSRPVVANMMRLLDLPEGTRELIRIGALTAAHGAVLCKWKKWPDVVESLSGWIANNRMTAGDLEKPALPFVVDLEEKGLALEIDDYRLTPAELKKWREDPDTIKVKHPYGGDQLVTFAPKRYQEWEDERAKKAAERIAKKHGKDAESVGSVADVQTFGYQGEHYGLVESLPETHRAMLPEGSVQMAKDYSGDVIEICTDIKAFRALQIKASREKKAKLRKRMKEVRDKATGRLWGAPEATCAEAEIAAMVLVRLVHGMMISSKKIRETAKDLDIRIPEEALCPKGSYGFAAEPWEALRCVPAMQLYGLAFELLWSKDVEAGIRDNHMPKELAWFAGVAEEAEETEETGKEVSA